MQWGTSEEEGHGKAGKNESTAGVVRSMDPARSSGVRLAKKVSRCRTRETRVEGARTHASRNYSWKSGNSPASGPDEVAEMTSAQNGNVKRWCSAARISETTERQGSSLDGHDTPKSFTEPQDGLPCRLRGLET